MCPNATSREVHKINIRYIVGLAAGRRGKRRCRLAVQSFLRERYGLEQQRKRKERKDNNLGNREHTIYRYLQGTTRTVSRVLVGAMATRSPDERGGDGVDEVVRLSPRGWVLNATFFSR